MVLVLFLWCRRFGVTAKIHRMLNARQIDGPELFYIPEDFVAYTKCTVCILLVEDLFSLPTCTLVYVSQQASNQTIDRAVVTSFFADVKIHTTIFFIIFFEHAYRNTIIYFPKYWNNNSWTGKFCLSWLLLWAQELHFGTKSEKWAYLLEFVSQSMISNWKANEE